MTWFKVDDGFWSHPKTLTLSAHAVALWVRAGSYCGKHLTDGWLSAGLLPMLQGTTDHAEELITAGLWIPVEGGYQFYDWHRYQDLRETVEKRREAWKDRQRRYRKAEEIDEPFSSNPSIPFHSKATRDSRRESPRESRRDTTEDKPTPTPPPIAVVLADLDRKVAQG